MNTDGAAGGNNGGDADQSTRKERVLMLGLGDTAYVNNAVYTTKYNPWNFIPLVSRQIPCVLADACLYAGNPHRKSRYVRGMEGTDLWGALRFGRRI